jgi:serine/threonine protein kinase
MRKDQKKIKIADFGSARDFNSTLSLQKNLYGTMLYLAPE